MEHEPLLALFQIKVSTLFSSLCALKKHTQIQLLINFIRCH